VPVVGGRLKPSTGAAKRASPTRTPDRPDLSDNQSLGDAQRSGGVTAAALPSSDTWTSEARDPQCCSRGQITLVHGMSLVVYSIKIQSQKD